MVDGGNKDEGSVVGDRQGEIFRGAESLPLLGSRPDTKNLCHSSAEMDPYPADMVGHLGHCMTERIVEKKIEGTRNYTVECFGALETGQGLSPDCTGQRGPSWLQGLRRARTSDPRDRI